jgi:thiol-disulfide isomerase/thioredoxin
MNIKLQKIFLAVLFISVCIAADKNEPGPLVGTTAKFWSLKTIEGKFEKLNNYTAPMDADWTAESERKVIVFSFFASWCQPCIKEIGELHKLQESYKDAPVQFFLVNLTDFFRHREKDTKQYRDAPDAMEFLGRKGLTDITVLQDPTGRTARAYGVSNVLPRLFVIDKYRTVAMDETGLCPTCLQDELSPLLDKLIAD